MAPKRRSASAKEQKKSSSSNSPTTEKMDAGVPTTTEEALPTLLAAEIPSKKWQNWWIRTITTLIMIGAFFIVLASGYIWSIVMVMIITVLVYREVISIAYHSAKGNLRWFKTMSW